MNGKEDVAYVNNGILLSHKKDKILPFATILVGLKGIMPNEIKSDGKGKYFMISLIFGTLKHEQNTADKNRHRCRDHISAYRR